MISIDFTIYLYTVQCQFVSNANRRAVNCCAESLKITAFACSSSGMHMYLILYQSIVKATQMVLEGFHFTS